MLERPGIGSIGTLSVEDIHVHRVLPYARGEIKYPNGDIYRGELVNGQRHGKGEYIFACGGCCKGEWVNDKMNGEGILVFQNNDRYEGQFRDGKKHGKGKYIYVDGSEYEGQLENDERCGIGTYIDIDGGRYTGEWKDDRIFVSVEKNKRKNDVVTVVFRSEEIGNQSDLFLRYEKDKYLEGGKQIRSVTMSEGDKLDELLERSNILECDHQDKIRIVFDEHASSYDSSNVNHTSQDFTDMLRLCMVSGIKNLIVSDSSCHSAATRQLRGAKLPKGVRIVHHRCRKQSSLFDVLGGDAEGQTRVVQRWLDKDGRARKRERYVYQDGRWKGNGTLLP